MGLFSKKNKSDKKWCVLYMYINPVGSLREILDNREGLDVLQLYNMRIHFTQSLFFREFRKYGEKKMISFYPDQWPAPVLKPDSESSVSYAREAASAFVAAELPELNGNVPEMDLRVLGNGDFAALCFEYGE